MPLIGASGSATGTNNAFTGVRTQRILEVIFYSKEYVALVRRFVSGFYYVIDATFNTNWRNLPLLILTGVNSDGSTFPFTYYVITSKLPSAFRFIREQLTELFFPCGDEPRLIIGDFATGLAAARYIHQLKLP
jgi:MULE transposase domain